MANIVINTLMKSDHPGEWHNWQTFRKPVQKSTLGSKDSLQSISYLYSGLWSDWSAEVLCHWLSINRTVYYWGSSIGFFNPAVPTGIFPQSRNPDGFYRLIPIPVIFSKSLPQHKRSLKFRSRFLHSRPSRPKHWLLDISALKRWSSSFVLHD